MSDDPFSDAGRTSGPIDAQFEPAPAVSAEAARPGPGWAALAAVGLISALIGAAAGAFGAGFVGPDPSGDLAAAQKRLETRIGELAAVQAAIDEKLSEPAAASAELAGLIGELDTVSRRLDQAIAAGGDPQALAVLAERLDALERGSPASSPDVTALTERLAGLEAAALAAAAESSAAVKSSGSRAEAALALSAIESATRRGAGFEADYRALRTAVPGNANVKRLAPYVSGVTALTTLQAEFPKVRAAVVAAADPETTSGRLSWIDRTFGDAVSVRPANGKHSTVTKALDAAAAALDAGDLPASVQALAVLDENAALAAEDWTRRANRRITLEEALEDVRLSLVEGGN
ncbi:MAG: hypothetical protein FP825_09700 [Hyphomonas sp.]|uniref:hypothetical protein n=1 Tax=Hyphomonas sp. TaxID=87 RepID=UPI00183A3442|nr:hypothetical protein [Hyphomonas sp.]MBA3068743.1 hypothetical protein [Hyphomonas sp.]MBU3920790.1 hypothetical protein [Alphaproteobacteria bacterium]MBU4063593.1 hypothetical protein [Alphaproteobacteria bacterium]MBU4165782.1 hypothetical protein [Alphaproteobacteria bacterium]